LDPAYLSATAAFAGAIIGGGPSFATAWLTTTSQARMPGQNYPEFDDPRAESMKICSGADRSTSFRPSAKPQSRRSAVRLDR
jgi:hypothetical protein